MTKAELTVIMASVKSYVEGRLSQIEGRMGPPGERGERGLDGKDAPPVDISALAAEVLMQVPVPKNGVDGKDGRDGVDGKEGQQGLQGPQGERGLQGESVIGPKGEAGPQGERGEAIAGPAGPQGEKGERGADAVLPDLEPLIQRAVDSGFSRWAVDMERRAHDLFQRAIERMPAPKDGKDGFELEDLSVTDDSHGNVTLTFMRGELSRSFSLRLPCFEYCGTFLEGQRYLSGHGVTYGGSFWIARKDDAQGKPGDRDTDWILAVKKGRDGRDGVMKELKPEATVKL